MTKPPFVRWTPNEQFAEVEVVLRGGDHKLQEELDFKSVSVQSVDLATNGDIPEESVSFGFGQVTRKLM